MSAFETARNKELEEADTAAKEKKPTLETPPIGSIVTGRDAFEKATVTGELKEIKIIYGELFGVIIDKEKVQHKIKIDPSAEIIMPPKAVESENQPPISKIERIIDTTPNAVTPLAETDIESILLDPDGPTVKKQVADILDYEELLKDAPSEIERKLPPPPPPPKAENPEPKISKAPLEAESKLAEIIEATPISNYVSGAEIKDIPLEPEPTLVKNEEAGIVETATEKNEATTPESPVEEINRRLATLKNEFDTNVGSFSPESWSAGKKEIISILSKDLGVLTNDLENPLKVSSTKLQQLTDSFFYSPSEFENNYEKIKGEISSELNPQPESKEFKEESVSRNEAPSIITKAEEAIETEKLNAKTEVVIPPLEEKTPADLKEETVPITPELTEKTPAGKMESARAAYLDLYEKNRLFQKRYERGSLFTEDEQGEWTQIKNDLEIKGEEYRASRQGYLESTLKQFETEQIDKELAFFKHDADFPNLPLGAKFDANEYKKSRLQEKATLELTAEFKKLHDAKTEKAAESYGPKFLERIREFGRNYNKQPLYRKLMLGGAIMGGGMLAALGGGGIGAAFAAAIGVGKIAQRAVSGTAMFVTVEALVKRKQDKILAKKIEKNEIYFKAEIDAAAERFTNGEKAGGLIDFLKTQDKTLENRYNENQAELKKMEKRMAYRRIFYAGAGGLVIGTGLLSYGVHKAINVFGSLTDLHSVEAPSGHSGFEAPTDTSHVAPSETIHSTSPDTLSAKPTPNIFDERINAKPDLSKITNLESELSRPIATVKPGGSFWEAAKSLLHESKISPEKFDEAWRHSFAEINGVKTPLSELGLSHPGDHLTFIDDPGNPHFEISDHLKFGTDEDLFKYLKSAGKTIPQWLSEKFGK
ncbi:MAG: hypothetical protein WCX12_02605 [Candidatus Paceibacterota bacterium]|jgi:hypothetical protein